MSRKTIFFLVFNVALVAFAAVFGKVQNGAKKNLKMVIQYDRPPSFLTDSIVNKLLTQNASLAFNQHKDSLVLNQVETVLEQNAVVEKAEVFLEPSGILGIKITEREPFFLVEDTLNYFVDRKAKRFPFAANFSNPMPTFKGTLPEEKREEVVELLLKLQEDSFLAYELNTLAYRNGNYQLKLQSFPFVVTLGGVQKMDEKIEKLKIFCAYQKAQDTLRGFEEINLQYENQVVALTPDAL